MEPVQMHDGRDTGGIRGRARNVALLATILLASVAGTAGSSSAEDAASSPDGSSRADACVSPALTIIMDMEAMTPAAESAMTGIQTHATDEPSPTESILFMVLLANGPMPPFREHLIAIQGKPHGRAAILLTGTDQVQDPELTALLLQETRDLLATHGQPDADTMPAFLDDDPNLDLLMLGLAASS